MKVSHTFIGICVLIAIFTGGRKLYLSYRDASRVESVNQLRKEKPNPNDQYSDQQKIAYSSCLNQVNENYKKGWLQVCASKRYSNDSKAPYLPGNPTSPIARQSNSDFLDIGKTPEQEFCQLSEQETLVLKNFQVDGNRNCTRLLGQPLILK